MLEFLLNKIFCRIEKVFPFRVVFHLSVKLYRIFWCVYPFWKDSINFSILSSLICSFLSTHFNPNIWIFRLPIRLSSFMCPCVRFLIASPSRDVLAIKLNVTRALPALRAVVGLDGLEPSTSRLSGARSSHLSYRPVYSKAYSVRSTVPRWSLFSPHRSSTVWSVKNGIRT